METKTIKQSVTFKVSPHEVYEAIMDSKKHSLFTGGAAKISRKVGGRFSAYGGYAEGENLEIVPDKKIIQSWRANDWPENYYSTTTYTLEETKGGTRLTFTQTNVPEQQYKDVAQGWRDYYWKPMKEMLEK